MLCRGMCLQNKAGTIVKVRSPGVSVYGMVAGEAGICFVIRSLHSVPMPCVLLVWAVDMCCEVQCVNAGCVICSVQIICRAVPTSLVISVKQALMLLF